MTIPNDVKTSNQLTNVLRMWFKRVCKDIHKNENSNYLQGMGLHMGFLFSFFFSESEYISLNSRDVISVDGAM